MCGLEVSPISTAGAFTARADAVDDQFVAALNAQNIPGDRGAEIGIAQEYCNAPIGMGTDCGSCYEWSRS